MFCLSTFAILLLKHALLQSDSWTGQVMLESNFARWPCVSDLPPLLEGGCCSRSCVAWQRGLVGSLSLYTVSEVFACSDFFVSCALLQLLGTSLLVASWLCVSRSSVTPQHHARSTVELTILNMISKSYSS